MGSHGFLDGDYPGGGAGPRAIHAGPPPAEADGPDRGAFLAEIFFPELVKWRGVLARLGLAPREACRIAAEAREKGVDLADGIVAAGIDPDRLARAMAADLGVKTAESVDPDRLVIREEHARALLRRHGGHVPVKLLEKGGAVSFLITPEHLRSEAARRRIRASPALAARLKLVPAPVLRAAVLARSRPFLVRLAVGGLFERFPRMSARFVAEAWQGLVVGLAMAAVPAGLLLFPLETLLVLHGLATFFFLACVALRFAAVAAPPQPAAGPAAAVPSAAEAPRFCVLVALYREAAAVPHLIAALDGLVWPRAKLEVRLVCEADDAPTLAAIRARALPPGMDVVEVPPGGPRTKPKALAYALAQSGGDFVALYDAEDRPDPMQLVEAWHCFRRGGPDLAVVQAPLEISNPGAGMIARMFAFEYAALFRGLLPWLSSRRSVLPLGGTSNHFRREALEAVGGWDPFNVTEDADLGLRFARFGYRAETICRPTLETAPERLSVWLPQRTRWLKGWMQTFLVHMRDPRGLAADLGLRSFLVMQVLFAGTLASVLLHPLLPATAVVIVVRLTAEGPVGPAGSLLLLLDVVSICCGYASFLLLGWQSLTPPERRGFWKVVLFTPVYWMMMSVAGWRAAWQLWRRPHLWEKTPHETFPAGNPVGTAPREKGEARR